MGPPGDDRTGEQEIILRREPGLREERVCYKTTGQTRGSETTALAWLAPIIAQMIRGIVLPGGCGRGIRARVPLH